MGYETPLWGAERCSEEVGRMWYGTAGSVASWSVQRSEGQGTGEGPALQLCTPGETARLRGLGWAEGRSARRAHLLPMWPRSCSDTARRSRRGWTAGDTAAALHNVDCRADLSSPTVYYSIHCPQPTRGHRSVWAESQISRSRCTCIPFKTGIEVHGTGVSTAAAAAHTCTGCMFMSCTLVKSMLSAAAATAAAADASLDGTLSGWDCGDMVSSAT